MNHCHPNKFNEIKIRIQKGNVGSAEITEKPRQFQGVWRDIGFLFHFLYPLYK